MAFSLAEYATQAIERRTRAIAFNFLRYSPLMEDLSFENQDSLLITGLKVRSLPNVAFRSVNEGYTASEGRTEPVYDGLYAFGGEIEIDRVFKKLKNMQQPAKEGQVLLKSKAMALKFNDHLINGDVAVEVDGFNGLKKRVSNMPSRQLYAFTAAGATAFDPTASAATARTFMHKMRTAYKRCNNRNVGAIYMNEDLELGLSKIADLISMSGDEFGEKTDIFGHEVITYRGVPLRDTGYKIDMSSEVIPNTETALDAGSDATSMYFVSFDKAEGLVPMQLDDIEIYDPLNGGERESVPSNMMRVEWWLGLHSPGDYGIVRAYNISDPSLWT